MKHSQAGEEVLEHQWFLKNGKISLRYLRPAIDEWGLSSAVVAWDSNCIAYIGTCKTHRQPSQGQGFNPLSPHCFWTNLPPPFSISSYRRFLGSYQPLHIKNANTVIQVLMRHSWKALDLRYCLLALSTTNKGSKKLLALSIEYYRIVSYLYKSACKLNDKMGS